MKFFGKSKASVLADLEELISVSDKLIQEFAKEGRFRASTISKLSAVSKKMKDKYE